MVATGFYITLKVLDYGKVYGTQDRDDTILVAKLVPLDFGDSQQTANGAIVVNRPNREYFEEKDMVVVQPPNGPGASGSEEGQKIKGTVMV